VFSDAPYGIRGVANNIQQLASNLFFMSKKTNEATGKTVGFGGAIGSLLKNLIGPAGILVAFQAGIALLDYFKVGMSTSADKTEKADEATKEFSSSLKSLEKILTDSGASQDAYNGKIVEYISLKKAQLKLEETLLTTQGKIDAKTEESKESLKDDISLQKALLEAKKETADQSLIVYPDTKIGRQAKAQAVDYGITIQQIGDRLENNIVFRKQLEQDIIELTKEGIDEITKVEEARKNLAKAEKGTLKNLKQQKSDLEKIRQTTALTSKEYIKQGNDIERIQKLIEEIEGKKLKKSSKGKKISPFKTSKELELDVENNLSAIDKLQRRTDTQLLKNREKEELSLATTEQQKKQIKERYAIENLEIQIKYELKALDLKAKIEETGAVEKQKAYVKGLDAKLIAYEKSLRDEKGALSRVSKEALSLATTETESLKKESKKELASTVSGIQEEYAKLFPFWVQFAEARRVALGVGGTEDGEDPVEKELEGVAFYVEQYTKLMSGIGDFLQAESDRELAIEQNKTNELNTELNNRLLNENLSKNQRQAIQNEIAQNDEKLRIKQNAIKKKAFNTQKAFNISLAIANTVSAGISAASATYGGPIAKIAAMTAVIGAGMAQVAVIARQRFQPDSANTPINTGSGGGGGSGRAEPSFNIVGRSNDNILLSAIQSQFDQPLRAYVVARDVTNQQQLDGVISTSAST